MKWAFTAVVAGTISASIPPLRFAPGRRIVFYPSLVLTHMDRRVDLGGMNDGELILFLVGGLLVLMVWFRSKKSQQARDELRTMESVERAHLLAKSHARTNVSITMDGDHRNETQTDPRPKIRVHIRPDNGWLQVAVTDEEGYLIDEALVREQDLIPRPLKGVLPLRGYEVVGLTLRKRKR